MSMIMSMIMSPCLPSLKSQCCCLSCRAKSWNAEVFSQMATATCPTNPNLFTKQQFCQAMFLLFRPARFHNHFPASRFVSCPFLCRRTSYLVSMVSCARRQRNCATVSVSMVAKWLLARHLHCDELIGQSFVFVGQGHTFLAPASCQNVTATAFCEARRERGEVGKGYRVTS